MAYPTQSGFNLNWYNVSDVGSLQISRGDYAGNNGDFSYVPHGAGPGDLASGENLTPKDYNGIFAECSTVTVAAVKDGTSNTLLVGEKYLNPDSYATGADGGDNESIFSGNDNDIYRVAYYDASNPAASKMPMQDRPAFADSYRFGSAHAGGCNFVFCDGSVHTISFSIDPFTYRCLGNRKDYEPVDASQF